MKISSRAKNREREWHLCDGLNKVAVQKQKATPIAPFSSQINRAHPNRCGTRGKLQFLLEAINQLDAVFENVECYGHEIPCVRSVKELGQRLKVQLENDYGAFSRVLEELKKANVSGLGRIVTRVEKLQSVVNEMINDDVNYIRHLEDIRQYLGEMSGLVEVILEVEYLKG